MRLNQCISVTWFATILFASQVSAQSQLKSIDVTKAQQVAQKSLCLGCHKVDGKSVGPSFIQISKKYPIADQKTITQLSIKVKNGGSGNWGVVAMPANAKNIRDDELDLVLRWILIGAPTK